MGNTNSSHPPMSRRSSTEEDFQALQKQEMIDLIVLLKQKLQDLLFLKEQKADSNFLTSNESSVTDYLPVNVRESLHGSVSDLHQPHPNLKNSKKSKNNTLNFNEPLDFEIEHQQNLKSGKNSKTSLNSELNLANSTTSLTNILSNEAIRNRDLKLALQETYSLRSYSSTSNKFSWISQSHNSSGRSTPMNENLKQGHMLESNHSIFKGYCEVCLLPCFFKSSTCRYCQISVHEKCSKNLTRKCPKLTKHSFLIRQFNLKPISASCSLIVNLNCTDCGSKMDTFLKLKYCHFHQKFYCKNCHWDDKFIIPQNILYNWDFTSYPVSRSAVLILKYYYHSPFLKISNANNGQLFRKIKNLAKTQRIRSKLIDMYDYLSKCNSAIQSKLVNQSLTFLVSDVDLSGQKSSKNKRLVNKSYLVLDSSPDCNMLYSLSDLIEIASGKMIKNLKSAEKIFNQHIRLDCLTCKGRGHYCQLCQKGSLNQKYFNQPLFPFDMEEQFENTIHVCSDCGCVSHNACVVRERQKSGTENYKCQACNFIASKQQARSRELPPEPKMYENINFYQTARRNKSNSVTESLYSCGRSSSNLTFTSKDLLNASLKHLINPSSLNKTPSTSYFSNNSTTHYSQVALPENALEDQNLSSNLNSRLNSRVEEKVPSILDASISEGQQYLENLNENLNSGSEDHQFALSTCILKEEIGCVLNELQDI